MGNEGYRTIAGPVSFGVIKTRFMIAVNEPYDRTLIDWLTRPMTMDDTKAIVGALGSAPGLTEHDGTNKFQNLSEHELVMRTKKYQGGFEYDEDMPQHKFWSEYGPKITQMGQRARDHEATLLIVRLEDNPACYDGKALFADDHPLKDGGVNDNLHTGSGTSLENFTTDYWAAKAAMRKFKDDQNQLLNRRDIRVGVTVPSELERVATELQKQVLTGSGETNVVKNLFELFVDPQLTDATDWYFFSIGSASKLMVHNEYLPPTIKQYRNDDNDLIKVSAKRIQNFYPADYTLGVKIVNA